MSKVWYKFKSVSKRKSKNSKIAKKLYKIETLILITPNNINNYSIDYEDDDYRIEVKTNMNEKNGNYNSIDFKSRVTEDGELLIKTNLISNFDYRKTSKKLNEMLFKSNYSENNTYITIKFFPKKIESIGKFGVMLIKVSKKKQNRKIKQYKLNSVPYMKIVQGGGCSGK